MNQFPQGPQVIQVVATKSNLPAMIGFWLAVAGFVTCGVTGIPALIVSALGAREEPRGYAIAGIFISLPSVAWSAFWLFNWTMLLIGAATH